MAHQWDPNNLKVVFGTAVIEGWAPDEFVLIEYNEDRFSLLVGATGAAARSKSNDESARITMRLMPGSLSNAVFSAALAADIVEGLGSWPLTITDLSTGTVHFAKGAWVVRPINTSYNTAAQPKEWVLETDRLLNQGHGPSLINT